MTSKLNRKTRMILPHGSIVATYPFVFGATFQPGQEVILERRRYMVAREVREVRSETSDSIEVTVTLLPWQAEWDRSFDGVKCPPSLAERALDLALRTAR